MFVCPNICSKISITYCKSRKDEQVELTGESENTVSDGKFEALVSWRRIDRGHEKLWWVKVDHWLFDPFAAKIMDSD